jgi:hypothetical protein
LIFTCQFAPFDVIRLPPAPILDYSVELFCEVYVNLREAIRGMAIWDLAAPKCRHKWAVQPPILQISNRNSPELEFALNHSKQGTSEFPIATKTRVQDYGHFKSQISHLHST